VILTGILELKIAFFYAADLSSNPRETLLKIKSENVGLVCVAIAREIMRILIAIIPVAL